MKFSDTISLAGLAVIMMMLFVASDGPLRPILRLVREDPKLADFIDPAVLAAKQQPTDAAVVDAEHLSPVVAATLHSSRRP